ncbi:MAG TPA: ChbG/HpnK family deacetylase [Candidatus Sulfotelmatobacter sp.]
MRRLIVNADDFGYTLGVNRAIVEAHTSGIVTSTTLMASGSAFRDAACKAKQLPQLGVGCHIVLIDGEPVLDPAILRSITTRNSGSPEFRDGLKSFAFRALSGRLDPGELEAEASAQIRKIQAEGISISHLDSHKHTHLFPAVLRPILRAARACGVRALRNPFGPRRPLKSGDLLARPSLWTRYAEVRLLNALAGRFHDTVKKEGFVTPDGTLGVEVTGSLDEALFYAVANIIPEGTWEFVCHPGYNDGDLQRSNTRLRESRETELRVLTMPAVRQLLAEQDIKLISYRDLSA